MKFFRYRRPSLKTLLGITKAKKQLKKDLGITALLKPFRWWPNKKRQIKRKIGYESDVGRLFRNGLPRPGGCLVVLGIVGILVVGTAMTWAFAARAGSEVRPRHPSLQLEDIKYDHGRNELSRHRRQAAGF